MTGDQSQVNAALADLSFIPALNNDVSSTLTYSVVDGTGLSSDPVVLALQAIGVYDPPHWNQDVTDQTLRHDGIFTSLIFADGFESGDLSAWSSTVPGGKVNVGLNRQGGSTQLGKKMLSTTTVGWVLTITPVPGQSGTTQVLLTVSDGVGEDVDTLNVTVLTKPRYTLTTLVANGTGGTVTPTTTEYDSCTWVTITAVPDAGYRFQEWSGDLTGSVNPDSLHMNGNKTVTAGSRD